MNKRTIKFLPVISAILLLGPFAPIPLCADDIFGDIVKNAANQATNKAIEAVPTLLAGGGKAKSGHAKTPGTDADQAPQTQAKSHPKKRGTPTLTAEEPAMTETAIKATQSEVPSAATPTVEEGNGFAGTQGSFPVSALKSVEPFQRFQPTPQAAARSFFDQGMAALAHRDPQKAVGFWKDAIRMDPAFKAARVALDKLLSRHPDFQ